jgi:superfamily II DNA or RNA helicase
MIDLRPYQSEVLEKVEAAIAAGKKRILVVAPTGSGKTVIASEQIRRRTEPPVLQSAMMLAHRREIITQTHRKLFEHGVQAGIIQAGFDPRPLERAQVASIQTLWTRAVNSKSMQLPTAHLLIIDEAHHAPARTYQKIIEAYPDAIVIGLTATPCRGDGRGLGNFFEVMIECPQVAELIELGFLVKTRCYAPVDPNLKGVETRQGDYVVSQLAERMDKPKLIGDIIENWFKHGEGRKTAVFATSVGHSLHIRDEFVRAGVKAEHIDGTTPKDERDATLARLASGEITVVCNCMVLTEGWDMPEVGCCILARPTKQMGLYRQMIGRVLRPAPGKQYATVLDHSGAVHRHGLPEDHVEWTLDVDKKASSPGHEKRQSKSSTSLLECTQCGSVRKGGQPCPCCGFLPQRPAEYQTITPGELGLVQGGRAKANQYTPADRERWHGMFVSIAQERGYSPKWPTASYKQKFGTWPPYGVRPAPVNPSPEALSWVRSRAIAYAKAKQKAASA